MAAGKSFHFSRMYEHHVIFLKYFMYFSLKDGAQKIGHDLIRRSWREWYKSK